MRSVLLLSAFISVLVVSACGSKEAAPPAAGGGGKHVDAATTGTLTGKVMFQGTAPAPETVNLSGDPACGAPSAPSDAVLISAAGELQNVFVYVKDGLDPAYTFDVPSTPVVLNQKGCHYTPRVLGVRVGQAMDVVNDDPTMHNVHSLPKQNQEFNQSTPFQKAKVTLHFTTPEAMVRFKCDVHAWMTAYVGVVAHPYFAVTGPDGHFEITGLPPGTYTVEAWHEKFGTQTQQVTIASHQAQSATFTFTPKS